MGWLDRFRRKPLAPDAERELFRDQTALWVYEIGKELDLRGQRYHLTRVESSHEPGKLGFPIYIVYGRLIQPDAH
ncbi:MAG: hypothetical protein H7338_12470 [Candidatus Sericytochromatia bacterium]|nr:hypothetical protein [Candidatus Sericytochromatia bacterium]